MAAKNDEVTPEVLEAELRKEEKLTRVSMVILVFGMLLVFVFCLGLMFRFGIISLPEEISGLFESSGGKGAVSENERIYAALRDGSVYESGDGGQMAVRELDEDELTALFSASAAAESYAMTVTTTYYSHGSDGEVSQSASERRAVTKYADDESGTVYTVEELDEDDVVVRKTECADGKVTVTQLGSGGEAVSREYPLREDTFGFEAVAGLPDLDAVRAAAAAIASGADSAGGSAAEHGEFLALRILVTDTDTMYYVSYRHPAPHDNLVDDYYISLRYGIALRAESRVDGKLIWDLSADAAF